MTSEILLYVSKKLYHFHFMSMLMEYGCVPTKELHAEGMPEMTTKPKVLIIGLDSTPSNLLFKDLAGYLPNIQRMMENGTFATLESCHPPITVPAWMVMMTSKSPGMLGIYGFRHRKAFSY